jgi:hypothetical protein
VKDNILISKNSQRIFSNNFVRIIIASGLEKALLAFSKEMRENSAELLIWEVVGKR